MSAEKRQKLFVRVERATEVPMLLLAIVFLVAIAAPEVIDLSLTSSSPKNAPAASATKSFLQRLDRLESRLLDRPQS